MNARPLVLAGIVAFIAAPLCVAEPDLSGLIVKSNLEALSNRIQLGTQQSFNVTYTLSDIPALCVTTMTLSIDGFDVLTFPGAGASGTFTFGSGPVSAATLSFTNLKNSGQRTARLRAVYSGNCGDPTGEDTTSTTVSLLPIGAPTVLGVSPTSVQAGSPNTTVTITGNNFYNNSSVSIAGLGSPQSRTDSNSSTSMMVTVPSSVLAAAGPVALTVISGVDGGSNVQSSTFNGFGVGPSISSLNPAAVPVGSVSTLTVNGAQFQNGATVVWTPPSAPSVDLTTTFVGSSQLTAVLPAGAVPTPGTGTAVVRNGDGFKSDSASLPVVAPGLSTVTPNNILAGSPQQTLVVAGTSFGTGSIVQWTPQGGSTTALATTFVNSTQLQATVPPALLTTPGNVQITVQSGPGNVTAPAGLVIGTFTLDSMTPTAAAPGSSAFSITLTGQNLPSTGIVTWDNGTQETDLSTSFVNSTRMVAIVTPDKTATAGTVFVRVRNGAVRSAAQTFYVSAAPSIDSLSPAIMAPGSPTFTLLLNGAGFTPQSVVTWTAGGVPQTLASTFISGAAIQATVPAILITAAGTAVIEVSNPGPAKSNSRTFTVGVPAAVLTNLNPSSVPAGSPDFMLTLSGLSFTSGAVVRWNGTALTTNFISPTELTATVPSSLIAAPASAQVTVQQGGTDSNALQFVAAGTAPIISSLSPTSAPPGGPAFQLNVTGVNFTPTSTVQWNAAGFTTNLPTAFQSSTALIAQVPATLIATPGPVFITVLNSGGSVSLAATFTVGTQALPVIQSINPAAVTAASSDTSVAITGTGFATAAVVHWTVGGSTVTLTPAALVPTRIDVVLPGTLLQTAAWASITVAQSGGSSNAVPFNVTGGTPSLTSLSPNRAAPGTSAFQLNLTGAGFLPNSIVRWTAGGTTTSLVTGYSSGSQLIAIVPADLAASAGVAFVTVQNPGGTTSLPLTFTVGSTNPPAISSLSQTAIAVGSPALQLTINGQNFTADAVVQWIQGGSAVTLTSASVQPNAIVVTIPAAQLAAPVDASVLVQQTSGVSNSVRFSVFGTDPVLTSLTPDQVAPGSASLQVTLAGTGFVNGSTVTWNNGTLTTELTPVFVSPTTLNLIVPAGLIASPGAALVSVVNPGGASSRPRTFTIGTTTGPQISQVNGLSPASTPAGSSAFQLTVNGANFTNAAAVQWTANGVTTPLATAFISGTQLTASVPSNLVASEGSAVVNISQSGAQSNGVVFSITGPPPVLTKLSQVEANAGSAGFVLTVEGQSFVNGSIVQWTGTTGVVQLATGFVESGKLTALVPAPLIAAQGAALVSVVNPGGTVSATLNFAIKSQTGDSPVINDPNASIDPGLSQKSITAGSNSFSLTVRGDKFVQGAVVQWNSGSGAQNLATGFVTARALTALVPTALVANPGTALITVLNPGGATSNAVTFAIDSQAESKRPAISPLTATPPGLELPPSLSGGVIAGGSAFELTVNGSNFQRGAVVQWNAGTGPQNLTTGFQTDTQLKALVPASLITKPGTVFVAVQNPDGGSSNTVSLNVRAPEGTVPTLTKIDPTEVFAGATGFQLNVEGDNFQPGAQVQWNNGSSVTNLATGVTNSTRLTAVVPASLVSQPGVAFVSIANPGNAISGALIFTVKSISGTPEINRVGTALEPASAATGSASFELRVNGSSFINGAVVQWNGGSGPQPLTTGFVSGNQLRAIVPASLLLSPGSVFITVLNPGGAVSNAVTFTVSGASPVITGVNPSVLSAGAGAIQLTVAGLNFAPGMSVFWGTTPLPATFVSSTQMVAAVPSTLTSTNGTFDITVQQGAIKSNAVSVSVGLPSIILLSPRAAPANSPAFTLAVGGGNFVNGSQVLWGSTPLITQYISANQLTAQVTAAQLATAGNVAVTVLNPGGAVSEPVQFSVGAPMAISGIAPSTAVVGSGALTLIVTGSNFTNGSVVQWNGAPLATNFVSDSQLSARVQPELLSNAGSVNVNVFGASVSNTLQFIVSAPPAATITGLNPPSAIAGGPAFQLTVAGTNFTQGSVVQWNGQPLATGFVNSTQLTALVDGTLIATAGTVNVSVQAPNAPLSANTRFLVNGPAITSLSPNSVAAASLPFDLTVTGANFMPGSVIEWNGLPLPTAFVSSTQLRATVATDLIRTASSISVTVRNPGGASSAASTFTVGPFTLEMTTTSLRDAVVGRAYLDTIAARGGTPPYAFSLGGSLPDGLTLEPATGTIAGTPLAPGTVNFTVTLTDAERRTVTRALTLRSAPALTITTVPSLGNVLVNSQFSTTLAASGGTAPYIWTAPAQLPPGLALNTTTGEIAGTPNTPGFYRFTVRCRDSRQQDEPRDFTLTVLPPVTSFTIGGGLTDSLEPATQPRVELTIAQPYPVDITGALTLNFSSEVGGDDSSIQFSTGGRRVDFRIPAGSTSAVYGDADDLALGTGTLAGTMTLRATLTAGTLTITPQPAPVRIMRIARQAPVLTTVAFTRGETGVIVTMTGFSTTREVQRGTFRFNPRAGSNITSSEVTSQLQSLFQQWYQSQSTTAGGSVFRLSMPFNVSGRVDAIESVTVTLTNNQGTSEAVTANLQ